MSAGRVAEIELDPTDVYFTHSRIRPFFTGVGCAIEQTISEIEAGRLCVEDIPLITVLYSGSSYFSLNNRRLYMLKYLKQQGLLKDGVCKVRLKKMLDREKTKYTVQNCVLQATLMGKGSVEEEEDIDVDQHTFSPAVEAGKLKSKCSSNSTSKACPATIIAKAGDLGTGAQSKLKLLMKLADKGKVEQCSKQLQALLDERGITAEEKGFMAQELGIN